MARGDDGVDAAAHVEVADHRHAPRCERSHEIVQNPVGDILVEVALSSERPEVELQGFQLDALVRGSVDNPDRREVRLAGARADTGEFRTLERDLVVPPGPWVGKGLQVAASLHFSPAFVARPRRWLS